MLSVWSRFAAIRVRLLRARSALHEQLAKLNPTGNTPSGVAEDQMSVSLDQLAVEDGNLSGGSAGRATRQEGSKATRPSWQLIWLGGTAASGWTPRASRSELYSRERPGAGLLSAEQPAFNGPRPQLGAHTHLLVVQHFHASKLSAAAIKLPNDDRRNAHFTPRDRHTQGAPRP